MVTLFSSRRAHTLGPTDTPEPSCSPKLSPPPHSFDSPRHFLTIHFIFFWSSTRPIAQTYYTSHLRRPLLSHILAKLQGSARDTHSRSRRSSRIKVTTPSFAPQHTHYKNGREHLRRDRNRGKPFTPFLPTLPSSLHPQHLQQVSN